MASAMSENNAITIFFQIDLAFPLLVFFVLLCCVRLDRRNSGIEYLLNFIN